MEEFVDNPPEDRIFPSDTDKGNTPDCIYDISRAFNEEVDIPAEATAAFTVLDNFSNEFQLSKTKYVYLVVSFSGNFKSDDSVQSVQDRLKDIREENLATLEEKHKAWWAVHPQ